MYGAFFFVYFEFIGTCNIMAPEVMYNCGLVTYSVKVDSWSLGVILYQLLSGDLPHLDGAKMTEKRWEKISDEAKDLVKKLINEDPVERVDAVQVLEHVWLQGDNEVCKMAKSIICDSKESENRVRRTLKFSGF